jgi:hypothetical protein
MIAMTGDTRKARPRTGRAWRSHGSENQHGALTGAQGLPFLKKGPPAAQPNQQQPHEHTSAPVMAFGGDDPSRFGGSFFGN